MCKCATNFGSRRFRADSSSAPALRDSRRVFPVASLLSAVEIETLARDIETVRAGDVSEQHPIEDIAADIESLFVHAALDPHKLKPALLVDGKPHTGGKSHHEIMHALGTKEALRAFSEDNNHIFIDDHGKQYTREQAAHALGQGGRLHSHELEALQASAPKITAARPRKPIPAKFKRHEQIRKTAEKIYMAALKGVLAKAEAEVLHNLRNQGTVQASSPKITATTPTWANINFDLKSFAGSFLDAMSKASEAAWSVTSRGLLTELSKGEMLTPEGLAHDFIERRANKISGCPENIWEQVDRSIREGIERGETMDELADRVEEEFGAIEDGRAMTIAQTESQALYGTAQADAIERAGFDKKRWVSMDDDLVRPTHAQCEDEGSIPVDQPFSNGLMFPGDPDADDAGEVVNCRCYLAAGEEEDDEE